MNSHKIEASTRSLPCLVMLSYVGWVMLVAENTKEGFVATLFLLAPWFSLFYDAVSGESDFI